MDPHGMQPNSARQTIVTVVLTGIAAAFFLLLFVLISGGLFIFLIGVVAAFIAFGVFHYLLWGRLLLEETAGEREEEQLRQQALADASSDDADERIRRPSEGERVQKRRRPELGD